MIVRPNRVRRPAADILKKATRLMFSTDDPLLSMLRARRKDKPFKKLTERELIQLESQIGATIFGEVPGNVLRREFFNLDETTWIWHEEVLGADGKREELTTRYEVHPKGVLKVQPGPRYTYLEGAEMQNFVLAVQEYYERVSRQVYKVK